jgi:hypothetical protein
MDALTSSLFARILRFACLGTLLRSASPAFAFTHSLFGNLDNYGIALIIAFTIVVAVLILIIYISELACVAVLEAEHPC